MYQALFLRAGYQAREKPNLPICAYEIGDLENYNFSLIKKIKKKLSFLLYLMRPGLRNKEFTYNGLKVELVRIVNTIL